MASTLDSITARLSSLSVTASLPESKSVPTTTYAFKPKGTTAAKLVLVCLEHGRELGKASNLAKGLKDIKDLRADEATLKDVLGVSKAEASPLALTSENGSSVIVVLSKTLPAELSFQTADGQAVKLSSEALRKYLAGVGAQVEEAEFAEKGAAAPAAAAAPVAKAPHSTTKPSQAESSSAAAGQPAHSAAVSASIGVSIKKDSDDFGGWYQQVLIRGDMLDYYDISGCYILKPWSYGIWQDIQTFFDAEIKKLGVQNAYFPMFVSSKVLEREKDHIEGFAPEVAWVTRAGQSDLEEPIAIRPTSETVMYPYYAKWIQSYRDLPLKLNQWNSVVRWEFKNPQPFLRTREFLWQEGHTAFMTKAESDTEVRQILNLYRRVYEELLAVPVVEGVKSEKEKFAGGLYTTTVEGFVPTTGRGIQGGTSHSLGQNFSKMFNIVVEDPNAPADKAAGKEAAKLHVWQNSWGLSTRTIGVMVMIHGDDKGLVLPPRVAQMQVVIVPTGLTSKTSEADKQKVDQGVDTLVKTLKEAGVRVHADLRDNYSPPFKYNDWEMRGVPIRLELGPRDVAQNSTVAVRRDNGAKESLSLDGIATSIKSLLETIHNDMFERARATYQERLTIVREWKDFVPTLNKNRVCVIPWCEVEACEDAIKDQSAKESAVQVDEKAPSAGAKSLCIPFDQQRFGDLGEGAKCPKCGEPAKRWTMFGRSY